MAVKLTCARTEANELVWGLGTGNCGFEIEIGKRSQNNQARQCTGFIGAHAPPNPSDWKLAPSMATKQNSQPRKMHAASPARKRQSQSFYVNPDGGRNNYCTTKSSKDMRFWKFSGNPGASPESPKSIPKGSSIEPRSPWVFRGTPDAFQERPKAAQERPRATQEHPKSA